MGAQVQAAVGQALQRGGLLQAPVLGAEPHVATAEAAAPVAVLQLPVEGQAKPQVGPLQAQLGLLPLERARAGQAQVTQGALAGFEVVGIELQGAVLPGIQPGLKPQLTQALGTEADPLAIEGQLALGCVEAAGEVEAPLEAAEQAGPELTKPIEGDVQPAIEALLQAALAVDAVVAQACLNLLQRPALPFATGLGQEHGGLAAQLALEVEVRREGEAIRHAPLAGEVAGQATGQFGDPVGGVEVLEGKLGVPIHCAGEAHLDAPLGLALAGGQAQVGQLHLAQVTLERTGEGEVAGRPLQGGIELPVVVAVEVLHLAVEALQAHGRLVDRGIQPVPGEVTPGDAGIQGQGLLPVDPPVQVERLLRRSHQSQSLEVRALGVHTAGQVEAYVTALARQAGVPFDRVALRQVAPGLEGEPL